MFVWGAHHILAMNQKDGKVGFGYFAGRQMTLKGKAAFVADGENISRIDRQATRAQFTVIGRKEKTHLQQPGYLTRPID